MDTIAIGKRKIGKGQKTYVIAEIGINHNGRMNLSKQLIKESAAAGADAVKFQKRDAHSVVIGANLNPHPVGRLSKTAKDIVKGAPSFGGWSYPDTRLELSEANYRELKHYAEKIGVDFIASPWDEKSTDFLVDLGVPFLKIPGVEILNPSFLEYVAKTGLPLVVSTGTAGIREVDSAVRVIKKYNKNFCLLQCTSAYPSRPEEIDLRVLETLRSRYNVPVGYSGHEAGIHISVAAAALGACVIERHVTLSREMSGPDHGASIEMHELKQMVEQIRDVELALGSPVKKHYTSENALIKAIGRSVVASVRIPAGTKITKDMLTTKAPSTGLPPAKLGSLVGKKAKVDIEADTLIAPNQIRS